MTADWRSEDNKTKAEYRADLEARYGKRITRAILRATAAPPPRKKSVVAKDSYGRRVVAVRGHAENPNVSPSAVDFRHHRARKEAGR